MSIPKIIHYCWFGGGAISPENRKCMESWKKYCPDYKIIEWNDQNFDISTNRYAQQAYEAKKYAFVSDYVRLAVLYEYGGIYLDTDVELVRPLDELLERKEGVSLTLLLRSTADGAYTLAENDWCVYSFLDEARGSAQELSDVVRDAVSPYMVERAWNGKDMTMSATALSQAVNAMAESVEWGEKREMGRIGLDLHDQICKDLVEELVREIIGLHFNNYYYCEMKKKKISDTSSSSSSASQFITMSHIAPVYK